MTRRRGPDFATKVLLIPPVAKSVPGPPLTDPAAILAVVREATDGGWWHAAPEAVHAQELLLRVGAICAERAAAGKAPVVTRADLDRIDLPSGGSGGLGLQPELDFLREDALIGRDDQGGAVILGPPVIIKVSAGKYLGWPEGRPYKGLPYLKPGPMRLMIAALFRELLAEGLPASVTLPGDMAAEFDARRIKGEIELPRWAWEGLVNVRLSQSGHHPVRGQTVKNRLAELLESDDLVCVRPPRHKLTGRGWRTLPAVLALFCEATAALADRWREWRERRRRRQLVRTSREDEGSARWRDLSARWGYRVESAAVLRV